MCMCKDIYLVGIMSKRIKILTVACFIAIALLAVELSLFGYGAVKIVRYICLIVALYPIAIIDYRKKIIPNKILLVLLAMRLVLFVAEYIVYSNTAITVYLSSFMGGLIGFVIMGICYFITKGGMGAGDVKLFFVMGMFLGPRVIMGVAFMSALVAAIYSIVLLLRKRTTMKETLPFGPFVFVGTFITMGMGF